MATINFFLDKNRVRSDGTSHLYLVVNDRTGNRKVKLGLLLKPEFWDSSMQRVKEDYPLHVRFNLLLGKIRLSAEEVLLVQYGKDLQTIFNSVVDALDIYQPDGQIKEKEDKRLFKSRFLHFAERKNTSTKGVYMQTYRKLSLWLGDKFDNLRFEDITPGWLRDFDAHLAKTAPSANARGIHFRNIRAVFNDALDDEIISNYPFRRFKIKTQDTVKRSLTVEDLRRIIDADVDEWNKMHRDMFVLSFMLCGINVVDMARLREVSGGRVKYIRAKTHKVYSIKVEPEAMAIINRWRGESQLLRIMDRYNDHRDYIHHLNHGLKSIGTHFINGKATEGDAWFPELSSYWARHTWATLASDLDVPKETIAAALGHGGNSVTDIYIRYNQKKIDEANRKVLDWVLYGKINGIVVEEGVKTSYSLASTAQSKIG